MPVPRGPNSHLWVPATRKSQPRSPTDGVDRPEAVDAVDAQQRALVDRPAGVAWARASAIARTGSRTPVPECTHVTATTRVVGVTAAIRRPTMSSAVAAAGSSYRRTRRTVTPSRSVRSRQAWWVE